jgi:hypothetical protein
MVEDPPQMRIVSSLGAAHLEGLSRFKWRTSADIAAYTLAADVA